MKLPSHSVQQYWKVGLAIPLLLLIAIIPVRLAIAHTEALQPQAILTLVQAGTSS